jgi:hypothetical protein
VSSEAEDWELLSKRITALPADVQRRIHTIILNILDAVEQPVLPSA